MKILEIYQYNTGDGPVVYRRGIQTGYEEMRSGVYLAKELVIIITATLLNSQGSLAELLIKKTTGQINSNHEMLVFDEDGKSE